MRSLGRWVLITGILGSLWLLTRAVVFSFLGTLAFFATAFQGSIYEMTKVAERAPREDLEASEGPTPSLPTRLAAGQAHHASEEARVVIDLRDEARSEAVTS